MEVVDLSIIGRKVLLFVAILSGLVVGEMLIVSVEEPATSVRQQAVYKAPPEK